METVSAEVVIAIPTLVADDALTDCLAALELQTYRRFAVILIDNSGRALTARLGSYNYALHRLENASNVGFGAAINQAASCSQGAYLVTLNDDCAPSPEWLAELVKVGEREYEIGMCAAQVRMAGERAELDSAGLRITRDGTSKQRGFRQQPEQFQGNAEVLTPSGSSALYRRAMLEDIGGFDESYFLYCEDTDLGLRARWAGWQAFYAAKAVVYHRYSHSSGQNSELKTYLVERNRIVTVLKNFPARDLSMAPLASVLRYLFSLMAALRGQGAAAQFHRQGQSFWRLPLIVVKAHWYAISHFREIWRRRKKVKRRMSPAQISTVLKRHRISLREVASL